MNLKTGVVETERELAMSNRQRLRDAGVRAVNLIGGAGCGKTSLLQTTVRRLAPALRVGAISADPALRGDVGLSGKLGSPLVRVDPGAGHHLTARQISRALDALELAKLDLVLIENVSSLMGPEAVDLGEDAKVAVFSVAAGAHLATKHPGMIRRSQAVVLNKIDLFTIAPFELEEFRVAVRRLNPAAELMEMSTSTGAGVDRWLEWVIDR